MHDSDIPVGGQGHLPFERWLPVVGWEGRYEASDRGRVRSLERRVEYMPGRVRTCAARIMRQSPDKDGYLNVNLAPGANGLRASKTRVHRIVLAAFVGPCPEGMEGCHGPGGRGNNRLGNLRWDTHTSNIGDKVAQGTAQRGEKNGWTRLTADQVTEIRALMGGGWRRRDTAGIAARFGVSEGHLYSIHYRKCWAHLP